ncbi:hypothetical protein ONZ43_g3255 [Nemania bipapillata]|uniref:Uncharacterized protein n=1 Tax=Nemania bipapillata TaxID=110536 RepID=A0ACC2IXL0_9PEZI|nr:hypothetical protein ONZ43_g3255 [Nemania bipapillata]
MAPTNERSNGRSRPHQHGPAKRKAVPRWNLGDIAFLKPEIMFSEAENRELLQTGRVHSNATCHPVIILDRSDDGQHYIVTTVSAYSSSEANNFLPPWAQRAHSQKDVNSFRAFEGSAKPNNNFQHLRLADNQKWPKVETSWVYIRRLYLVPLSTLVNYNKSPSQLRRDLDVPETQGGDSAGGNSGPSEEEQSKGVNKVARDPRTDPAKVTSWRSGNTEPTDAAANIANRVRKMISRAHDMSAVATIKGTGSYRERNYLYRLFNSSFSGWGTERKATDSGLSIEVSSSMQRRITQCGTIGIVFL